ncbi:uncharacterized protein LTR77_006083 [Saxophila tyrrhenica]|uniref:Endoplasmic reticulum-based factor for assembly of V-ATPase-domain-containing protein n=1 Tax=Saxophila tyrrhenica TaxID=1690608 RepID=A0AAV9PAD8_9PEZI|nr:hypothetical protein LTR77_006083 [Saxophila tyrrhenica]
MVLLTTTEAAKAAIEEYCKIDGEGQDEKPTDERLDRLSDVELGSPIDHADLIEISKYLLSNDKRNGGEEASRKWRLDTLLKGATVYKPPPTSKPEPTSEYKALMKRLRQDEEQQKYERMLNPPPAESFGQRFPNARPSFGSNHLGPHGVAGEVDEVTYADVNRQMTLIINVLVSIICCSIAIWIAARRWEVPARLGLSMSGSGLVAAAEVVIYMGYIRRVKDAKGLETKKVESKEIVETWVLDGSSANSKFEGSDGVRFRKGKHR